MFFKNAKQIVAAKRPSFTLIELLVAIAIIGFMAGMVMFSLAGAQRDAKVARTRGTLEKINSVILQEWEEFRYRAAKINLDDDVLRPIVDNPADQTLRGQPPLSPREGARLRMIVLRDQMRMEMPDRMTDILYPPTAYRTALFTANNSPPTVITADDRPLSLDRFVPGKLNFYRQVLNTAGRNLVGGAAPSVGDFPNPFPRGSVVNPSPALSAFATPALQVVQANEEAEWLYQIVATADYAGGSALESFRSTEIGDVDGDGLPEFIDAWGLPIRFIRWPAGYPSPLNNTSVPDPFDPVRTDWRWLDGAPGNEPWLLVPLIVSAGPDGIFDLNFTLDLPVAEHRWSPPLPVYSSGGNYYFPNPYRPIGGTGSTYLGSIADSNGDMITTGYSDNITNYDLILD